MVAFTNLNGAETSQSCPLLELDGHTMQVKLPEWVAVGSAVKVEGGDTLSLGEVSDCRADGDGYVVSVELMESLQHVSELARLARALMA